MASPRFHTLALLSVVGAVSAEGYCNDKSTACAAWAKDGECTGKNAATLASMCPLSCGTCSHECKEGAPCEWGERPGPA